MLTVQAETLDPCQAPQCISGLLTAAWRPPSLLYSIEYVRWQLATPAQQRSVAIGVFDGRQLCACAALIPRTVSTGGRTFDVYISTFGGVLPQYRGRGFAITAYEAIFEAAVASRTPVIGFVVPNGGGERALLHAAKNLALNYVRLTDCRTYAAMPTIRACGDDGNAACTVEFADAQPFAITRVLPAAGPTVIRLQPSAEQRAHYADDPRSRRIVIARDEAGASVAAGMIVCAEVTSAAGVDRVTVIDWIAQAGSGIDGAVRPLANFAKSCFPDFTPVAMTIPNAGTVPAASLRAAGFRATASVFRPYVLASERHPLLAASSTDVEVI